jgi:transcriptional regulator with PAS, ATPase and Fis domain
MDDTRQTSNYGLIGKSEPMLQVYKSIKRASSTSATVLITGDSGTGKELVARAIHYNSSRSSQAFVPVNCGAIPEGLLESELFGHVKGAFTGAAQSRAGFFQTADKGTIFLDEISDTSLSMQTKLLRVIQSGEIYMVGSSLPRKVDVRILAASNKDLFSLVKKELFREDLYYRLNVIHINIPSLSGRNDDIPLLLGYFANKFSKEYNKTTKKFSNEAIKVLLNYNWPGNVRELENLVHQLIVMTDTDIIDIPDLPVYMRFSEPKGISPNRTLREMEIIHIRNVLAQVNGNKSKAAEILGISRKTLSNKLSAKD